MSRKYDRMLERATEPTLLEPNWHEIMNCVDAIRSGDVPAPAALECIRKRYHNENPHVAHHALLVLEASVKNCGPKVHREVAKKDFMEDLKHLAHECKTDKVKEKLLELVQCWAHAFRNQAEYKIVVDTHNLMKLEGFEFAQLRESEAMFAGESAPDWVDNNTCFRCKVTFGMITRKHHCRACGQIFCDKCSARYMVLPHIGIEKEVRVCETCYEKFSKPVAAGGAAAVATSQPGAAAVPFDTIKQMLAATSQPQPTAAAGGEPLPEAKKKERQAAEEEELQLAMALSQSEAEEAERKRQVGRVMMLYNLYNGPDDGGSGEQQQQQPTSIYRGTADSTEQQPPPPVNSTYEQQPTAAATNGSAGEDNELARYLNRDYWESRRKQQQNKSPTSSSTNNNTVNNRQSPTPSAPPPSAEPEPVDTGKQEEQPVRNGVADGPHNDDDNADTPASVTAMRAQIEMFVNRIRSNQARGRSIVADQSIQAQFVALTNLHSDVLNRMQGLDQRRAEYESLQDRVQHIAEAREAVNALREEHERQRQARLLAEQQRRQQQMQFKLDIMRHKKHEMLEQQRVLALQRFQAQQAELAVRKQQALQQQHYVAQPPQSMPPPYQGDPQQQQQPVYNMQGMQMALPAAPNGYPVASTAVVGSHAAIQQYPPQQQHPAAVSGAPVAQQHYPPASMPQQGMPPPPVYSQQQPIMYPPQQQQAPPPVYAPPQPPQHVQPQHHPQSQPPQQQQYYAAPPVYAAAPQQPPPPQQQQQQQPVEPEPPVANLIEF